MPNNILDGINTPFKRPSVGSSQSVPLGSKYDESTLPVIGNEKAAVDLARSRRQNNWDSLANTLTRGLGKAVLTVPETIGYLMDVPEMIGMVDEYDNKLSEWSRESKSWLDEQMPEYSRQIADNKFRPTDSEWWFRNGDSIIESLGYFIPGYAVGKGTATGLKLLKAGSQIQKYGSAVSAAVALNYAETMQSAGSHYKESVKQYIDNGYSEPEARQLAADEASSIVWQGKINTVFELPAMMSLFKAFSPIGKGSRALAGVDKIAAPSIKSSLLKQVGSEYAEEVGLGFIQSEAERKRNMRLDKDVSSDSYLRRLVDHALSSEGLTEGVLGALGGGVFGAITAKQEKNKHLQEQDFVKQITGKNAEDLRVLVDDLNKFNKQEATAIKDRDREQFDITQKQKLSAIAYHNAVNGTFSQFLEQLDTASELTDGDANLLKDYKQQAKYVEKVANQIETQYQDKSPQYKSILADNLVTQRILNSKFNDFEKQINEVYTDNPIVESYLNRLANQHGVYNDVAKKIADEPAKLKFVNKKIKDLETLIIQTVPGLEKPEQILKYSNPVIDGLVKPLETNKLRFEFKMNELVDEYDELTNKPNKAEQAIQDNIKEQRRKDIDDDIEQVRAAINKAATAEEAREAKKVFDDSKNDLTDSYTEDEINTVDRELEDIIKSKEREASATPDSQRLQDTTSDTKDDFSDYVEPDEPTVPDESNGISDEDVIPPDNAYESESVYEPEPVKGLVSTSEEFKTAGDIKKGEKISVIYDKTNGRPLKREMAKEFDFDLLNSPDINVGTQVELYVDSNSEYSKAGKGNTPETLHIKIRVNGKDIGNLPNFRSSGDPIADQRLLDVRRYLFNNLDKVINTKISGKTKGFMLFSKASDGKQLVSARNNIRAITPVVRLTIPNRDAEINYEKSNYGRGIPGAVYSLVPAANGTLTPVRLHARKFNKPEADAIAKFIKDRFKPTLINFSDVKQGDFILVDNIPYTALKTDKDAIVVYNTKSAKEIKIYPTDTIYKNNYIKAKDVLEDYIFFRAGYKVNFTQDRLLLNGDTYSLDDISTDQLSDIIQGLYFDANKKTLDKNESFTSITGRQYSSYGDFIADSNLYTTDLDVSRPFWGSRIYMEFPNLSTTEVAEPLPVEKEKTLPSYTSIKYARYADQGDGFSTADLQDESDSESIFEIREISSTEAEYVINTNSLAQKLALSNAGFYLNKTVRNLEDSYGSQIFTINPGKLRKEGNKWIIVERAEVSSKLSISDKSVDEAIKQVDEATKPKVVPKGKAGLGKKKFTFLPRSGSTKLTGDTILNFAIKNSSDTTKRLGELIKNKLDKNRDLSVKIQDIESKYGDDFSLFFSPDTNEIIIPQQTIDNVSAKDLSQGIIHEYIHAYSEYVLLKNTWYPDTLDKNEKTFVKTVNELYNYAREVIGDNTYYGMQDVSEFLAELSNPLFADRLKQIKIDTRNIFQRLIDAILELLGIKRNKTSNVYNEAYDAFEEYLSKAKVITPYSGEIRYAMIEGFTRAEKNARVDLINFMFQSVAEEITDKGLLSIENLTKAQVKEVYERIKQQFVEDIATDPTQAPLQKVVDRWDDFVKESKKNMVSLGYSYLEGLEEEETKESWQKRAFESNLKDTLSKPIKLYLRFITKLDSNGDYVLDDLGRVSFVPYQELSEYLMKNLADLDSHEQMLDKLLQLSRFRPELKNIYDDLTSPESSESFKNAFFTGFSVTKNRFITVLSEGEADNKKVQVIDSSRRNLSRDIIDEWRVTYQRNMYSNDTVDRDKARELLSRFNALRIKDIISEIQSNSISEILSGIGITINENAFTSMEQVDIAKYLTGPGSVSDILRRLSQGYDIFNVTEDEEKVGERKALTKLAELESKFRPEDITASLINGEGNVVYLIGQNTAVSKDTRRLKTTEGINEYLADPFYNPSEEYMNWGLKRLRDDLEFRSEFQLAVFDTERLNIPGYRGTAYSNISPLIWERAKIGMVLNQGNKYGWFPMPTPADKENIYVYRLPKHKLVKDESGKLSGESLEMYYSIFMQESARIHRAAAELRDWDENELIERYHYSPNITPKEAKADALRGKYSGRAFEYQIFKELNDSHPSTRYNYNVISRDTLQFSESDKTEIYDVINRYFSRRVNEKIKQYLDLELIADVNGALANKEIDVRSIAEYGSIKSAIENYVYNTHLGYWFISGITLGDPAYAKNYDDFIKRVALWQTPGTDVGDGVYSTVVVKDREEKSLYADDYKDALEKIGISKEKIEAVIGKFHETHPDSNTKYYKVNRTDAQGLCTLERYIDIARRQGELVQDLLDAVDALNRGQVTEEQLSILLVPRKGTNIGYRIFKGKRVPVAVKYSVIPVIPALRQYPRFAKLLADMESTGVDEIVFESGFKLGIQGKGDIKNPKTWHKIVLNNRSYRIPQVVPYKDSGTTLFPTQAMKNIMTNVVPDGKYQIGNDILSGSDAVTEYQELIYLNIAQDFDKLTKRLDITADTINNEKLQDVFLSESRKRNNIPDNYEKALDLIDGEFRVPVSIPLFSKVYENMYFSLFKKKVATRKVPGMSAVNVSDFNTTYDENKQLKFYTINYTNPVGGQEFTVDAAEIVVSQDYFRNVIKSRYPEYELEGDIDLSKIPEDLRYFVANRIPNQAKNSMVMCKIVGLLPKEQASQIMLPKEGTVQGGYDFDIDKSFILTKNFKVENGVIKTVQYFSKPEESNKRYAQYIEEYTKAEKIREALREYHADISDEESILYRMDNALEDKLNTILQVDRSAISDEEYYDILLDYFSLEGISEEDFSKLPITEQNTKPARENRIIDFFIGVLSSSHNFYESILPNNADNLVTVRKEILKVLNYAEEGIDIINDYQYENTRQRNQAGKQLIGVFAVKTGSRPYMQILKHETNKGVLFNGQYLNRFYETNDISNTPITDNNLEFLTAAVDNAKDPILGDLNINMFTADTTTYLNDLTVDLRTNMYFLGQPSLRELTKRWNNRGRTRTAGEEAYKEIAQEYLTKIRAQDNQYSPDGDPINFNTDELVDNFKKSVENPDNVDNMKYQLNVLNTFMRYREYARDYSDTVGATRADSTRTLPDMIGNKLYMDDYYRAIRELDQVIDRVENGNIIWREEKGRTEEKLRIMEGFTKYGIELPYKYSRNIFIWGEKLFTDLAERFTQIQSDSVTEDVLEALNYDMFSYIFMQENYPLANAKLHEYLMDNSLINRVNKYKALEKAAFDADSNYVMNPFIMSLTTRELDGYNMIVMDDTSGTRSKDQKSSLSDAWYEMFQKSKTSVLAWDLFAYSFFINGFNKGAFTFMDLIPVEILEQSGIVEYYRNIEKSLRMGNTLDLDLDDFIEKFLRQKKNHNLNVIRKVRKEGKRLLDAVMTDEHTLKVHIDDYNIQVDGKKRFPKMLSFYEEGKLRLFRFYQNQQGYGLYSEVTPLGTTAIREYLPGNQKFSIFTKNNEGIEVIEEVREVSPVVEDVSDSTDDFSNYIEPDDVSDDEVNDRIKDCE
jgi:hypothetical protein